MVRQTEIKVLCNPGEYETVSEVFARMLPGPVNFVVEEFERVKVGETVFLSPISGRVMAVGRGHATR